MSYSIDFGFEESGAAWEDARLALLFVGQCKPTELGRLPGPSAIADASRYVELFEMQTGSSTREIRTYAEIVNNSDPLIEAESRVAEARERGIFPIIVGEDRKLTEKCCANPLVALWGKMGRQSAGEAFLLSQRAAVIAGVRAATSTAFKAIPTNVTMITARALSDGPQALEKALAELEGPVHLSIDIDVLSPGTAQCPRSIEPGGLSWYGLMDAVETVFRGPGVAAVDLVGVKQINPESPAAVLSAQILMRVAGLMSLRFER